MEAIRGTDTSSIIEEGVFNRIRRDKPFAIACVLAALILILGLAAAVVVVRTGHSTNAACAVFYMSLALIVVVFLTWNLFFNRRGETPFGMADGNLLARIVGCSALLGVALDVLTYLSYTSGEFSLITISNAVKFVILFALSYVLLLVIAYQKPDIKGRIKAWACRVLTRKNVIRGTLTIGMSIVLGCIAGKASESVAGVSCYTASIFWTAVFVVIIAFVLLRHSAGEHPERCFLTVAMAFGIVMCFCTPQATVLGWDDDTHFGYALGLSYLNSPETMAVDIDLISPYRSNSSYYDGTAFTQDDFDNYHSTVNEKVYHAKKHVMSGFVTEDNCSTLHTSEACYVPAAVGLWLARLFHLSFSTMFLMGRLFELIFYCIVCYFAIKIAPARKVVLGVVALLPTVLFLASVYSYDYWLNCFVVLGIALVIREVCTPEKKITAGMWAGMCACFFIAVLPKPIYFPLFGLMFILPRSKFASPRHRKYYYASIVLAIIVVIATFAAPMVFLSSSGVVVGDDRGGSNISAAGQVAFVLSNPLHYAAILGNFLSDYLSVTGADNYAFYLAYLGNLANDYPAVKGATTLLLFSVALTNCDEHSIRLSKKSIIIWASVIAIGTVVLVASALYATFTPVESESIAGCQPRYLIPIILVFFTFALNPRLKMRTHSVAYVFAFMGLVALMNAACSWFLIVSAVAA